MHAANRSRDNAFVAVSRFALFFLCWMALAGVRAESLVFGAMAALIATFVSRRLARLDERPLRLWRLLLLAPGFVWMSIRGGIDVARRVFDPRLPLKAGWIEYCGILPAGTPRVMMAGELSLLPGTLAAGVREGRLLVHCLDTDAPVMRQIADEEQRFGEVIER